MYFIDNQGFLIKRVGTTSFKFIWDRNKMIWITSKEDPEELLDYSIEALKSKNDDDEELYIQFVLEYMKNQFYEEVLG